MPIRVRTIACLSMWLLMLGFIAVPTRAAKVPLATRIAGIKKTLTKAAASSKVPSVKKEIAAVQGLVDKSQLKPAREKVTELIRTAALGGENGSAVTLLVKAGDELDDAIKPRGKGKRK
jgi:hypothetical protein